MIKPIEKEITNIDGETKTFILSRMPATEAREVILLYPSSNTPKIGDYAKSDDVMNKMLKYAGVRLENGTEVMFQTKDILNSHVTDGPTLLKLEKAMFEHNVGFSIDGRILASLKEYAMKHLPSVIQMLTDSLPASFLQDLQHYQNSKEP